MCPREDDEVRVISEVETLWKRGSEMPIETN